MIFGLALSLVLGWLVGYERHYNGRIAGTQTYCLVCMTACAIASLSAHPSLWINSGAEPAADPSRTVGSIVTGIGFLGAGILVRTGTSIRGLTTAASVWGSSAIGILVGLDMIVPALTLTALFILCMSVLPTLEHHLPARAVLVATIRYEAKYSPSIDAINDFLASKRLRMAPGSMSVTFADDAFDLEFMIIGSTRTTTHTLENIAQDLPTVPYVSHFTLSHTTRG